MTDGQLETLVLALPLPHDVGVRVENFLGDLRGCERDQLVAFQAEEDACCDPYLQQQIALLKPKLILAVGRIAAQNLLKTDAPLTRLRGRVHHYCEAQTPLIITYHPAYLLRSPGDKRKAWEDLQFAVRTYRELQTGRLE